MRGEEGEVVGAVGVAGVGVDGEVVEEVEEVEAVEADEVIESNSRKIVPDLFDLWLVVVTGIRWSDQPTHNFPALHIYV